MTEEKLVERVTALFADSDAAQRKMIRLYAETNDAIEASAIIDSGAEVLHMLQGGLRPPGVFPGGVVHQSRGAVWRKWPGGALGSGTPECAAVQKQYAGLPDAVRAQRQDPAGSPDGK